MTMGLHEWVALSMLLQLAFALLSNKRRRELLLQPLPLQPLPLQSFLPVHLKQQLLLHH